MGSEIVELLLGATAVLVVFGSMLFVLHVS